MSRAPLSLASRNAIRGAQTANLGVYLSPFTAWEIGTLVAKGRLHLTLSPEVWFDSLLALPGMRLAALTPQLLIGSTALPGNPPSDPADRIIAATARIYGHRVITRDGKLLDYAARGHVLATAC
jgi:PIN domain nuclease of toxin-antitoxin system